MYRKSRAHYTRPLCPSFKRAFSAPVPQVAFGTRRTALRWRQCSGLVPYTNRNKSKEVFLHRDSVDKKTPLPMYVSYFLNAIRSHWGGIVPCTFLTRLRAGPRCTFYLLDRARKNANFLPVLSYTCHRPAKAPSMVLVPQPASETQERRNTALLSAAPARRSHLRRLVLSRRCPLLRTRITTTRPRPCASTATCVWRVQS